MKVTVNGLNYCLRSKLMLCKHNRTVPKDIELEDLNVIY